MVKQHVPGGQQWLKQRIVVTQSRWKLILLRADGSRLAVATEMPGVALQGGARRIMQGTRHLPLGWNRMRLLAARLQSSTQFPLKMPRTGPVRQQVASILIKAVHITMQIRYRVR